MRKGSLCLLEDGIGDAVPALGWWQVMTKSGESGGRSGDARGCIAKDERIRGGLGKECAEEHKDEEIRADGTHSRSR
jgi:hypothetical protein